MMHKLFQTLLIITSICFTHFACSMEVPQKPEQTDANFLLLREVIIHVAGQLRPADKNKLMHICKTYNERLKNRELVLQENPLTVSNYDKIRALFKYTRTGDAEKLKVWIPYIKQAGIKIDSTNIMGMTPFHIATHNKDKAIMELLIEYGADKMIPMPAMTKLHWAVYYGDLKTVTELLSHYVDPHCKDKHNPNMCISNSISPLHIAAYEGNIEIAKALVKKGAKINEESYHRSTPLWLAVLYSQQEIACWLIKKGAKINGYELIKASCHGDIEIVRTLIKKGSNVNKTIPGIGETALYCASAHNHFEIVKMLIHNGAKVNKGHNGGTTPLCVASHFNYIDIVEFLLKNGAQKKINRSCRFDIFDTMKYVGSNILFLEPVEGLPSTTNALCIAAQRGHGKVVQLLVEAGADIDWKNDFGQTALDIAHKEKHNDIVKFLQECKKPKNHENHSAKKKILLKK